MPGDFNEGARHIWSVWERILKETTRFGVSCPKRLSDFSVLTAVLHHAAPAKEALPPQSEPRPIVSPHWARHLHPSGPGVDTSNAVATLLPNSGTAAADVALRRLLRVLGARPHTKHVAAKRVRRQERRTSGSRGQIDKEIPNLEVPS